MNRYSRLLGWLAAAVTIVTASGCEKAVKIAPTNTLPIVSLTSAPIDESNRYYYSVTVNWSGYDPDGRVDHYLYTIDPQLLKTGEDTVWVMTDGNERRLQFQSDSTFVEGPENQQVRVGVRYHKFLIKAVDNRGAPGPYVSRSFYSWTAAPEVQITAPTISTIPTFVTPSVRVSWRGVDPDGVFTQKPVKYKYLLLGPASEFPVDLAPFKPDSLFSYYLNHPEGPWAGWDSTSADTTQVQFTNLTPSETYVFAVIAFDEAGAVTPEFSLTSNLLRMKVGFAQTLGPKITFFNDFFNYAYPSGGYSVDPTVEVYIEVPGGQPFTVNWFASPPEGSDIRSYRWAVDIENVADETARTNEQDHAHWSSKSANITFATLGPYNNTEEHRFYLEAEDNNGLRSLGIIRFDVVLPTFANELLVVDDTRFRGDLLLATGCMKPPNGTWPMRAELDTFLFAQGGRPWQCYPPGTVSSPGLFNGYDWDSIGTKVNRLDMTVRLAKLSQYRHVVWLIDGTGATNDRLGTHPTEPISTLRYMSAPGRFNTLGAYVRQGGLVWLAGGGGAFATSFPWNLTANDQGPTRRVFSSTGVVGELQPGRFMYDLAQWQSEIRLFYRTNAKIEKAKATRFRYSEPNKYISLPDKLEPKNATTDPLPPGRSAVDYYDTNFDVEFLQVENVIEEDINNNPDNPNFQPVLDTLYRVRGQQVVDLSGRQDTSEVGAPRYIGMTYYHGTTHREFVFSGFAPWKFKRDQCQALVDYVLGTIWSLPKNFSPTRVQRAVAAPARPATYLAPAGRPRLEGLDPAPMPRGAPVLQETKRLRPAAVDRR